MEVHFPGTASRYNSTHSPSASSPTTIKVLATETRLETASPLSTNTDATGLDAPVEG